MLYYNELPFVCRIPLLATLIVFYRYTGLAFTDADHLRKEHITTDENGTSWIHKPREKTAVMSRVPLLPHPIALLKKYECDAEVQAKGKLLPVPSNQKMNAYLKELATICNFDKTLTTHQRRHTFATTITLEKGVPIETVSEMLGHSHIATTQIYAKISGVKLKEDMSKLENRLDGRFLIPEAFLSSK